MEDTAPWPVGPHPDGQVTVDARTLRGLAHPLRLRLLGALRADGPSTATRLAEQFRLTSGATSYHLRQLAAYGFILEDTEKRGPGRERWWRAAHQSTRLNPADITEEAGDLTEAYLRSLAAIYTDQLGRALDEWLALPEQWRRVQRLSDFSLRLTPDELARFNDEILELIARYRADTDRNAPVTPADSAAVTVQIHTFRSPGAVENG
jgi:DNA-binding transcriptional ArsR family regulator